MLATMAYGSEVFHNAERMRKEVNSILLAPDIRLPTDHAKMTGP